MTNIAQSKILIGLDILLSRDSYLLVQDIHERTITHKLAEYYQQLFPDWNVDCEYNKNLSGPKKIAIDPKEILEEMANFIERHYGDNFLSTFLGDEFTMEDLEDLERELKNRENILYNDELDLVYFVINETSGKKIVKTIFPDIIIHHRGTKDNNIVIEAKKSSNKNKKSRLYDLVKLMTLVNSSEYNYKYGFFIDIPIGKDLSKHKCFKSNSLLSNKKVFQINSKNAYVV